MKSRKIIAILLLVLCISGCKKDDITPTISVSQSALYFSDWGAAPLSLTYTTTDAVSVAVSGVTSGWTSIVDQARCTLTVAPPASAELGYENSGMVTLTALSKDGVSSSRTIYLYVCDVVNFEDSANCHVATKPSTRYRFVARRADGSLVTPDEVELLWQTGYGLIDDVALEEGNVISFYVRQDVNGECPEGNGVIAALDDWGDVIWSWHIWVTKNNPCNDVAVYANNKSYMTRNIGSYANSNGSTDKQQILDTYGLYYQWGRKDPFLRPLSYNCAGGTSEEICDEQGTPVEMEVEQREDTDGTMEYATEYPMTFIANDVTDGGDDIGDWLITPDNTLWGDGSSKSVNDPCPAGWRVPTAEEWSILSLSAQEDATPLDEARKRYGWHLTDGQGSYFFLGAGYRRYTDGVLQNMNYKEGVYPSQPEPWEGYYWSSTPSGSNASCLFFDLTTTRLENKFNNNHPSRRANAMQVRCVRE